MIGLVLIYFIGKYFYDLAMEFQRKPWPYAILGVASFYGSQILFGAAIFVIAELMDYPEFFGMEETALNLLGIPAGVLFTWISYKLVQRNFKRKTIHTDVDVLDGEFIE